MLSLVNLGPDDFVAVCVADHDRQTMMRPAVVDEVERNLVGKLFGSRMIGSDLIPCVTNIRTVEDGEKVARHGTLQGSNALNGV